jgi:hypothetical protein
MTADCGEIIDAGRPSSGVHHAEDKGSENLDHPTVRAVARRVAPAAAICVALAMLVACATAPGKRGAPRDQEIEDVIRLPQQFGPYAAAAGERLGLGECSATLLEEFWSRYFSPWDSAAQKYEPAETKESMRKTALHAWYGENRRIMAPDLMRQILDNCSLDSFPSRNETAIAVAPTHLRGLPTLLPLFAKRDDYPFDMLQYPNVKLNEPLRVLHTSRDGAWLYVENTNSGGWLQARDVALADRSFIDSWMALPRLVIIRDYATIIDGRSRTGPPAKIGTILPLVASGDGWWEVAVASAGEGSRAVRGTARLPREAAAPCPLPFSRENIALIGDQLIGQPYGWGEMYGLRDCSATIRDFFLPFGVWLPRTAADQIASVRKRRDLTGLTPQEKEDSIRREAVPFLTLLYKPGHIMLYVGTEPSGRPLVFHNAWSVRLKDTAVEREHFIGKAVITTLEPGKELGLAEGRTLLEQGESMATITDRCAKTPVTAK